MRQLEKDPSDIETPISVSLDLQFLRQSEKPEERSLADLVAAVADLRGSLSTVETRVGTKDEEGLLGEIQIGLRNLNTRLDESFDGLRIPRLRRGRFHPMMFRELLHMNSRNSPALGVLIFASLFRDTMPWLYEMGTEVYRISKHGSAEELQEAAREFRQAVDFSVNGPMSREFFGRSKEMFMVMEEIEPMLERTLEMLGLEGKLGKRKSRKENSDET
jgi:hypothetical protein